ncbi:hypothetical protein SAMN05421810_102381 [Amycolatopsis arida]|uniref:Uncharacterized protein n=1 Tax=Amycolatopsis arida TaxID=587909 RepID=A0A1I5PSG6_9PSEU|nr:hypothetical protein CLV69_101381 [Amycolatopsis arida]SFP36904.1 hypothetical protein SAMN05421810_102381 [Amycolatopsis arida]
MLAEPMAKALTCGNFGYRAWTSPRPLIVFPIRIGLPSVARVDSDTSEKGRTEWDLDD